MAEIVGGAKKQKEEAHAIRDPKTIELVVATEEIKMVSLAHSVEVLQSNTVEPETEIWVSIEHEIHEAMMKEETDQETNISLEDFEEVVQRFRTRNKSVYYFLTKGGETFQKPIYKLCRRFIRDENFPKNFSETLLKQLWKQKGRREILDNHRYIHLKEWKPRLTETLVTSMMKQDIIDAGTKFQIGGIPGHRVEGHLIVLKSFIQRRIKLNQGVVIQLVDFKKFFLDLKG